jgi:hypothetical protein
MRSHAQTAMIENGFVHIPEGAPWLAEYLHEMMVFPKGKHDDQVDSTAQFLDRFKIPMPQRGIFEHTRIMRLFTTASSFGNHPDGESGTVAQTEDIGDDIRGLTRLEDQVRHLRVGTRQEDAEGRRRHPGGVRDGAKSRGDVEGSRRLFFRLDNVAHFASLARKGMTGRDIAFLCHRAEARCSESAGERRRTSKPRHHNSATFLAPSSRSTVSLIVQYRPFVALLAYRGVPSGRGRPS